MKWLKEHRQAFKLAPVHLISDITLYDFIFFFPNLSEAQLGLML